MATAPRPGVSRRAQEAEAVKRPFRFKIRDEEHSVYLLNIPMRVQATVALPPPEGTGRMWEAWTGMDGNRQQYGVLSICCFWWVARLVRGDSLTWDEAMGEWDDLNLDISEIEILDDDDATPEGTSPEA